MGRLPPWTTAAQFHRGPFERDSVEHSPHEGSGIWATPAPCLLKVALGEFIVLELSVCHCGSGS